MARNLKLQRSAYPDNEWKADTWIRTAAGPGLILMLAPLGMGPPMPGGLTVSV